MNGALPPAFTQVPPLPQYPNVPISGKGTWQQLLNAMNDPRYDHWGIVVYRYPTTSTDMAIVAIKEGNVWQYKRWRANLEYRPDSRTTTAYEILESIWSYMTGENVFPKRVEVVGQEKTPQRLWLDLV